MSVDLRGGRYSTILAIAVVLAGSPRAWAASAEDRAAARQHLSQAQELKKRGQLADACKHLEEVERLDPKLPTLMELAECTEQLGKLVEAESYWSSARDRARHDEKPQSKERAEKRLASVQKRIAHVTLQLTAEASGARVLCDGAPLEAASLGSALPMNPGDHVIVVKLAGHDDASYAVKLSDSDSRTLPLAPGPAAGARPSPVPPPAPIVAPVVAPKVAATTPPQPRVQAEKTWWTGERTAGLVLGSIGLAAVGAGTATCIIANRDAKTHSFSSNGRFALGGISIATGSVLLVSGLVLLAGGSSDDASPHARLTVSPNLLVSVGSAELGATGEF